MDRRGTSVARTKAADAGAARPEGASPARARGRALPSSAAPEAHGLASKPLYRQVREALIRRMVDGVWAPGAPLPSEMQLAAELRVSQGTVRKALDEMAAENLVVRRQGRGTFVARHDEDRILFQFFKLVSDDGVRRFPESRVLSIAKGKASEDEAQALALVRGARVIRIRRMRALDGVPILVEDLALPETLFPGLVEAGVPNNVYGVYAARYGVTVARAREKLKAVAAPAEDAAVLGVPAGTPALLIDRLAFSLEEQPVEWRVSLCLTGTMHYLSDLT
ncbi:GntR family transcriptional regulator [Xanthobacter tagetidis]|uniref:GntR family transcriptional regulator n=1 Tax=Xanthobacter tagetidis TaxID=60216 RepID=A0A3L7ABB2_9HYPH|nr:GntR family transcriptional regulator [Xanthobacter tagetidis]MBB6306139.1 GntR family transcriptional regulator [Xanthobacter tagetidis]RLP77689.1 GntR family transcriptional regulator [Xanthobacter tagetidis]